MLRHIGFNRAAFDARGHVGNGRAVWAGTIVFFAALATVAIGVSARHHRAAGPIVIASLGLGLIVWVMYGAFNRVMEITGFVLLITAALWDWRASIAAGVSKVALVRSSGCAR